MLFVYLSESLSHPTGPTDFGSTFKLLKWFTQRKQKNSYL